VTPELARVLGWLVAGVTAYEVLAVGVPEARTIGFGLLLAGLFLAWIEWRPLAGGPVEARRRAADRALMARQAADRDAARLAVATVAIAEAGLLLALLRPVPAAPIAAAVALALSIALVALVIAGAPGAPGGSIGRRATRRQAWFAAGGVAITAILLVALMAAVAWPSVTGTVQGRVEALAAVAAGVLVILPALMVTPGSWRWPGLAILGTGAAAGLAALLAWPIVTTRPEIAVASVIAAASLAIVAAAILLGSPREPDRSTVTRGDATRIALTLVVVQGLLLVALAADWMLRHGR
jgi:hypothetical protein